MDLVNLIWIASIILVLLIVFSIIRNRYINFFIGLTLITLWMAITISLPFFLIYSFKIEGIYLLIIVFIIYTIYFIRSNLFIRTEIADKTEDIEIINLGKSIRLYVKSVYLTLVNTTVVILLILIGLGAVSIYPLIVLCSSVWFIPVAILGALAGVVAFGIVMIGFVPSIIINIIFTLNGVTRLLKALKYDSKEKAKHILFSLIPYWGVYDGIKLIWKANKELQLRGYKWKVRGYTKIESIHE